MKVSTVFDTHRFIMSLIQAGMAEEQATILSDTYTELLNDRLATKDDIKSVKKDITRLEQSTKDDIAGVKEAIARLEETMEKMKQTELRMTIVLGGIMATGIGIMAILYNL